MATKFNEKPDTHPCPPGLDKTDDKDSREALIEWGLSVSSLAEMEDWYGRVHDPIVKVVVEVSEPDGNEARFHRLRREWIRETDKFSRLTDIVMHPAYQQIIAIGPEAIPLILQSLENEVDHWFWALKMLNKGVDVAEGAETMPAAAATWLKWGRENGHLDSRGRIGDRSASLATELP